MVVIILTMSSILVQFRLNFFVHTKRRKACFLFAIQGDLCLTFAYMYEWMMMGGYVFTKNDLFHHNSHKFSMAITNNVLSRFYFFISFDNMLTFIETVWQDAGFTFNSNFSIKYPHNTHWASQQECIFFQMSPS